MEQREYRHIVGRLRKHDSRFEIHVRRGRGSHRKDLIRIFQLP